MWLLHRIFLCIYSPLTCSISAAVDCVFYNSQLPTLHIYYIASVNSYSCSFRPRGETYQYGFTLKSLASRVCWLIYIFHRFSETHGTRFFWLSHFFVAVTSMSLKHFSFLIFVYLQQSFSSNYQWIQVTACLNAACCAIYIRVARVPIDPLCIHADNFPNASGHTSTLRIITLT